MNNSNSTDRVCERPWAGGMAPKRVGPKEGRKKRTEKRTKRKERREKMFAS